MNNNNNNNNNKSKLKKKAGNSKKKPISSLFPFPLRDLKNETFKDKSILGSNPEKKTPLVSKAHLSVNKMDQKQAVKELKNQRKPSQNQKVNLKSNLGLIISPFLKTKKRKKKSLIKKISFDLLKKKSRTGENFFISCKTLRIESSNCFYGCFYLGPFDPGQSMTIGNALRRTLLSELRGIAITSVEIDGALHEYSILPGLQDSVLDILLNLKEVVLKKTTSFNFKKSQIGYLRVHGPGTVRAGDLLLPPFIQCVNPDQYIATLSEDGVLNMKLFMNEGKNYNLFSESPFPLTNKKIGAVNKQKGTKNTVVIEKKANRLFLDSVFMPVLKVNYIIEENKTSNDFLADQKSQQSSLYQFTKNLVSAKTSSVPVPKGKGPLFLSRRASLKNRKNTSLALSLKGANKLPHYKGRSFLSLKGSENIPFWSIQNQNKSQLKKRKRKLFEKIVGSFSNKNLYNKSFLFKKEQKEKKQNYSVNSSLKAFSNFNRKKNINSKIFQNFFLKNKINKPNTVFSKLKFKKNPLLTFYLKNTKSIQSRLKLINLNKYIYNKTNTDLKFSFKTKRELKLYPLKQKIQKLYKIQRLISSLRAKNRPKKKEQNILKKSSIHSFFSFFKKKKSKNNNKKKLSASPTLNRRNTVPKKGFLLNPTRSPSKAAPKGTETKKIGKAMTLNKAKGTKKKAASLLQGIQKNTRWKRILKLNKIFLQNSGLFNIRKNQYKKKYLSLKTLSPQNTKNETKQNLIQKHKTRNVPFPSIPGAKQIFFMAKKNKINKNLYKKKFSPFRPAGRKGTKILFLKQKRTNFALNNFTTAQNKIDFKHNLILEIWTNGSLHPREALYKGIKILLTTFSKLKQIRFVKNFYKSKTTYKSFLSFFIGKWKKTKKKF